MPILLLWSAALAAVLAVPGICRAVSPEQLVLVVNTAEPRSRELARYYAEKRGVPAENLLSLSTTTKEHISREDYEKRIAAPVRAFLDKHDPEAKQFKGLVLFYGLPLRVEAPRPTDDAAPKDTLEGASVDSELALVREASYRLHGWIPNPLFAGFRIKAPAAPLQKVLLVSRLDGPSAEIVRRIIDDSLQAEKEGLTGTAYFDARWKEPAPKGLNPYQVYDRALHNAARVVERSKRLTVVLDAQEGLFQPGEAPGAALYCGWYSLAKYVDAFTWARGAVGYHIASAECMTLKNTQSTVWCKKMLEHGAAATIGPVAEPYVNAFPVPDAFFGCLVEGRLSLAECYALALPSLSWQMVLIGDPLYRPFKQQRGSDPAASDRP